MELQASLVALVLLVPLAPLAPSARLADLVEMVSPVAPDLKVKLELPVSLEVLAEMDNLVPQADNPDPLDLQALLDNRASMALPEKMVSPVDQEHQAKTDFPADPVSQV
jgi:hypothetical protein